MSQPLQESSSYSSNLAQVNRLAADVRLKERTQIFKDDRGTRRVLLGKGKDGFYGLKVSKEGVDVYDASNADLVFNSSNNMFKIVDTVEYTYTMTSTDITNRYVELTIPHEQDFVPTVVGSAANSTSSTRFQLPYVYRDAASYFGVSPTESAAIDIHKVTATSIVVRVFLFDALGLSWILAGGQLSFKFYILQETIASV